MGYSHKQIEEQKNKIRTNHDNRCIDNDTSSMVR